MLNQKTTSFLFIFFLLLGIIIGVLGSYFLFSKNLHEKIDYWKNLAEKCFPPLPEMVVEQTGEVTEIGDFVLFLKYQEKVSRFPLPGGKEFEEKILKVNLSPETQIKRLEIVQNESGHFVAQTNLAQFEDIKIGDRVTIISDENIKGKTETSAHTIIILSK